ncbi:MAG TPA: lysylphosphatidylglycerol synthase transmembrane domain-containing protein [Anaerolineales bacterium]|nr:lysylphosphatidylglycerol synthase transmembrane domain-containing protein [Anaerolineales bacterium]
MEPNATKKTSSGMLLRIAGTTLTLILLVVLLSQQGWQEIGRAIQQIPIWKFFLALALMMVSRFAVAGRWHVLLCTANPQIKFLQSLRITFAGLFSTNFLPTTIGGDVIRLAGAIQLSLDPAFSTASLVVDRLVGMAGMLMVVPFGLPSFFAANQSQAFSSNTNSIHILGIAVWRERIWNFVNHLFKRFLDAISIWRNRPVVLLQSLLFSWLHMLCFFGVQWLLLNGLGESIDFWVVAGLYSLVYFVIILPFSINGYGLQEVSITFVFSSFGGVSIQNSLTLALLFRTIVMLASLPGAFFVPGLIRKKI